MWREEKLPENERTWDSNLLIVAELASSAASVLSLELFM